MAQGTSGRLYVGGLYVGRLTAWRVDLSPTTSKPTLFSEGVFYRYFLQAQGGQARAELTPAPQPHRIGRPKPGTPKPFVLEGKLLELRPGYVTISEGTIARD